MKLRIKDLSEITVSQYQKVDKCLRDNGDCEFTNQYIISIIYGVPLLEVQAMKKSIVDQVSKSIKETMTARPKLVQRFTYKGVDYGFIPNIEELSSGEYSDLESYITDPDNYHKCMAIMFRPIKSTHKDKYTIEEYKGTELTAEGMRNVPAEYLVGALVFFCDLERELLNASLDFIRNQTRELAESERLESNLNTLKSGGGILLLTDLLEEISYESKKLQKEVLKNA